MAYQETPRAKLPYNPGEALRKSVDRLEDDATGINVDQRKPIDARMPHLPPA
jgi:hypothetical protein